MGKCKLLKITTNYPNYISHMVQTHPEFEAMNYETALKNYFYDAYGWADFWKINLEATGNFECNEIVMNAEFLQKKWAAEHRVSYLESNWKNEIVIAQIKFHQPEVLFLIDQYNDNSISSSIKKIVPSIKLILGWDGILWHKPETFAYTDIVLTPVKDTVEFYKKQNKATYYYKFGFEESVLDRLTKKDEPYDVSFTGSIVPHPDYHLSRLYMIAELSRKVNLNIWASSIPEDWNMFKISKMLKIVRTRQWKYFSSIHEIGKNNKGEVYGLDMFNVLYNSKIVFNTHGDNSPKNAANMRMTEATGTGALLMTDWKENIHEFFKPDEEIVVYKSSGEAIDKIRMLLNDESLRSKIALNGQKRTLNEYSYSQRMKEFANFITNYLN